MAAGLADVRYALLAAANEPDADLPPVVSVEPQVGHEPRLSARGG